MNHEYSALGGINRALAGQVIGPPSKRTEVEDDDD
jgi:hypothetical protein